MTPSSFTLCANHPYLHHILVRKVLSDQLPRRIYDREWYKSHDNDNTKVKWNRMKDIHRVSFNHPTLFYLAEDKVKAMTDGMLREQVDTLRTSHTLYQARKQEAHKVGPVPVHNDGDIERYCILIG